MPTRRGNRRRVEQRAGIRHGWAYSCICAKYRRDQPGDIPQPGGGQLARVLFQLAGFIPINQLQRQRDITRRTW